MISGMGSAASSRLDLLNSFQSMVIVPFLSILFKRDIKKYYISIHVQNRGCSTTQAIKKSRRRLHPDDVYLFRTFSASCWEMCTPRSWSDCMISLESIRSEQKENLTFIPPGKCRLWSSQSQWPNAYLSSFHSCEWVYLQSFGRDS